MPILNRLKKTPVLFALALSAAATPLWLGCDTRRPAAKRPAAGQSAERDARGLFNSIRSQLRRLPEIAQLELMPPSVVVDARSSTDGEEIEGRLQRRPEAPGGLANLIVVPRGNSRFRGVVEPGDTVKYYGMPDRETQYRIRETGDVDIATFESIDLVVAQVLRDDALLIVGGFPQEDIAPRKIEVWRFTDERMEQIQREWSAYVARREPPLAWHPSPDESGLKQLTERLNQWLRQVGLAGKRADAASWKRPELLATLPPALAESADLRPFLSDDELATGYFRPHESRLIQGATWRRDVSRWARGGDATPKAIAASLFEWTIRNLQLVDTDQTPPRWPWESMLYGQATAAGRAWVFAGLCEQQNLATAAIAVKGDDGVQRTLVGVVDGDQLRLFDPVLGLPLPRRQTGDIATLEEVQSDDSLLRALDLDGAPYPLTAEAFKSARVMVIADPFALTQRASAFDARLTGDDSLVLAVDVDAAAKRLEEVKGVTEVTLWPTPFQTLLDLLNAKPSQRRQAVKEFLPFAWRPYLWRGRLQHFRGLREDSTAKRDALDEAVDDHQAAQRYYMKRNVRPTDDRLRSSPQEKRDIYIAARTLATLFLATLRYDESSYEVSEDWLESSALKDPSAEPFLPMVLYNRARALEKQGELTAAAELLDAIAGPMAPGAKVLAGRFRTQAGAETPPEDAPATSEP